MKLTGLTGQDVQFLLDLKDRLHTQDNRCTREPIFLVQSKYKKTAINENGSEVEYIECMSGDYCSYDSEEEMLNSLIEDGYDVTDVDDIQYYTHWFDYDWETINSHFTEAGAQAFINRKKHDYSELRIYGDSLVYCAEMTTLRDILMKIEIEQID
jgi:DNA-dependent RNA polymerase auxiliary subunit epsilon